jgi:hypothetical protein
MRDRLISWFVSGLIALLPFLATVQLAADLLKPVPPGLNAEPAATKSVEIGALKPGFTLRADVPVLEIPSRYIGFTSATWSTRPLSVWRVCSAAACRSTLIWTSDNSAFGLELPKSFGGGQATITLEHVWFGRLGVWGDSAGRPRMAPFEGTWVGPLGRANEWGRRMVGGWFLRLLGVYMGLLVTLAAFAARKAGFTQRLDLSGSSLARCGRPSQGRSRPQADRKR